MARVLLGTLVALLLWRSVPAQVTIVREPVYALDARAIVGANRVIGRTRFRRTAASSMPHELAVAAARHSGPARAEYERFFRSRLAAFVRAAPEAGIALDDAGDARAAFIQTAYKVYLGEAFANPRRALRGPGLWGEGAIAAMARRSASLAWLHFRLRLKFIMGSNRRFATLSDAGKERVYDFYAIAAQLLIDGAKAAARSSDRSASSNIRGQARRQLAADLGVSPEHLSFTPRGIETR